MALVFHKATYVSEYGELPYQEMYLPGNYVVIEALLPQLTADRYRFLGWYLTSTFDEGTKIEVGDTLEPKSYTFYAKWESITVKSTMTALADEIRILSGTEEAMSLDVMTTHVGEANTNVDTEAELIAQISSALEGKAGGGNLDTCSVTINFTSTGNPKNVWISGTQFIDNSITALSIIDDDANVNSGVTTPFIISNIVRNSALTISSSGRFMMGGITCDGCDLLYRSTSTYTISCKITEPVASITIVNAH